MSSVFIEPSYLSDSLAMIFQCFFFPLNFLKYMHQTPSRHIWQYLVFSRTFPDNSGGKEYTFDAGNPGSIPGLGRFPCRWDRLPTQVLLSFSGSSDGKESTCSVRDLGLILVGEISLEEGMTTHSIILAWKIPMDRGAWRATIHGVRHDWVTKCSILFLFYYEL